MAARGCKRQGWKEFGKEMREGGGAEGLVGRKAGRHIGAWRQVIHVGEPREVVLGAGAGLSKKAVQGGCDTGSNQLWVVSHQPAGSAWLAGPTIALALPGRTWAQARWLWLGWLGAQVGLVAAQQKRTLAVYAGSQREEFTKT